MRVIGGPSTELPNPLELLGERSVFYGRGRLWGSWMAPGWGVVTRRTEPRLGGRSFQPPSILWGGDGVNSRSCLHGGVSIKSPITGSRELLGWWVRPRAERVTHASPVGQKLQPGTLPELALGTASSGCLLLSFIIAFTMNWQT